VRRAEWYVHSVASDAIATASGATAAPAPGEDVDAMAALDAYGATLLEASLRVCQHIASPAVMDSLDKPEGAHEATLWLLFGCKFVQRVVTIASRPNSDGDVRLKHLLKQLRGLETALPSVN